MVVTQHEPLTLQKGSLLRRVNPRQVGRVPRQGGYPVWHVNSSVSFLKKGMIIWFSLGRSVSWITRFAVDPFLHVDKLLLASQLWGMGAGWKKGRSWEVKVHVGEAGELGKGRRRI